MGLFGPAAFDTERRTKEIGVRKAFGASVLAIVFHLSRQFARLVLVAIIMAILLAYIAMNERLQNFAFRIEIRWHMFLWAGLTALLVALLTVSCQAVRAAMTDPVKALRYE